LGGGPETKKKGKWKKGQKSGDPRKSFRTGDGT